ncbi:heavy metal sensor histidine kinase [Variovorax ginsengisoli]|uniref:Sensor protein n=1 Tax=Variovorax ginsengisoli TaxID=363844 RepID=A0ABT9S2D4_9BURK|nr:heavy metal sensor histidine kinase [Variovorax ginsengisoli]MDP9897946.1 two-component system heavy metal sensor histidine kinase CusS [Variovorax ginsengisoli]
MRRSITTRLVLMFAAAALATFALIGAALQGVLARELERHQHDELATTLKGLQYWIQTIGTPERWTRVQARMDALTPEDGSLRFWVLSDDPRFQYGKGLAEIDGLVREADGHGSNVMLPGQDRPFRTLSVRIPPFESRPAVRLVVGRNSEPYARTRETFLTALVALGLGAMLVVAFAGYWIARVGLRPLQQLSQEAQALRPKTLSQRLQAEALPVELSALAEAFNGALARLEQAYAQLEAFNADVAHELRTPLANLIGGTQVALSRPRAAPELQEVLASNLEDLERLRSIVNDMLFLARADRGEVATGLMLTPVAEEVRKTIEFFEFVLDETGGQVRVEGDLTAQAQLERALFRRALSNLLQNAIEHSGPGTVVTVTLREEADGTWIRVSNPGAPIGDDHLPHLFDRFYRVDEARRGQGEHHGHGLGLAIVKAVAAMHGGRVGAASADGINTFGFSVSAGMATRED